VSPREPSRFWREAFALHGSVTPIVLPHIAIFGASAALITFGSLVCEEYCGLKWAVEVAPLEIAGAALGLLLILRTNSGYDRWWEARKLWGGIVNQSRNTAISGVAYGPQDRQWQDEFLRWVAAFPHIAKNSLRGDPPSPEVARLLGSDETRRIENSGHMPSYVARRIALLLRDARDNGLDAYAFLQIDKERATLIDHIGACERILKTPLPKVYSIKIRRFISLFLLTLPFALIHRLQGEWLVPVVTMLVAYPLISLDQIGVELQNPFSKEHLGHLPLDEIATNIERNIFGLTEDNSPPLEEKDSSPQLLMQS
jgi:ion channel-forming bestrophin family protein